MTCSGHATHQRREVLVEEASAEEGEGGGPALREVLEALLCRDEARGHCFELIARDQRPAEDAIREESQRTPESNGARNPPQDTAVSGQFCAGSAGSCH